MEKQQTRGLTSIESLSVLAALAVILTLLVIALSVVRERSRDHIRLAHLRQIHAALEYYYNQNESYPLAEEIVLGSPTADCLNNSGFAEAGCASPIIKDIPTNPQPGGQPYVYQQLEGGKNFVISFALEGDSTGFSAGQHFFTSEGIE